MADDGLRDEKRRPEVHIEHLVERGLIRIRNGRASCEATHQMNEHIDFPGLRDSRVHDRLRRI